MINRLTNNNVSSARVFSLKDVKSEYLSLTNKIKRVFNISSEKVDTVKPKLNQSAMQGKLAGNEIAHYENRLKVHMLCLIRVILQRIILLKQNDSTV